MPAPNYTDKYNTPLTPAEEQAYQAWAIANKRTKDTYDYDMRGAWKAGISQAGNGHYPDTYKKPNHPTFSAESQYANPATMPGGVWGEDGQGHTTFTPSPFNLTNMTRDELLNYFRLREPGARLALPPPPAPSLKPR